PAYIATTLFVVSGNLLGLQYFMVAPRRAFMLALVIGMMAMATGIGLRIMLVKPPFTLTPSVFRAISTAEDPCLFLAFNSVLLARLAETFDKEVSDRCLLFRSSRFSKLSLWSNIVTFLIQAAGVGLTATKDTNLTNVGNKVILVGLILQFLSFELFTCILFVFGWRVFHYFPSAWRVKSALPFKLFSRQPIDWRILFYIMCLTCVGIIIRCIFRITEYAWGQDGIIATHEAYFYLFDSLPLWISMTLYCFVWPIRALSVHPGQIELLPSHT
ncbi:RTA-like protein, partial [Mycena epipterygia]